MSEDNNMFGNNGQQPEGFRQSEVDLNKRADQQSDVSLQKRADQQSEVSLQKRAGQQSEVNQPPEAGQQNYQQQQSYNGQQPDSGQQQGYNGQLSDYNQQQGYNQNYGDQNQQTPLSGYAEPVYHNQYNAEYEEQGQGFGIASLICGILSIVTCCCSCPCAPLAIVSIVLGILQISKGAGSGRGMAIAGIICSAVGLILMVISLVFTIVMNSSGFADSYYQNYYDIIQELENMDSYPTY